MSERSPFDGSCCGGYTGNDDSSSDSEPTPPPRYRIVMLGESGTGKTGMYTLKNVAFVIYVNIINPSNVTSQRELIALVNQVDRTIVS